MSDMSQNKEQNFVSAVLYVRNDMDIIKKSLSALSEVLKTHFVKYEIICVNDSSTDASALLIKEFADINKDLITLMSTGYYQGLERGMAAGVDLAIGDFVFEFDNSRFVSAPKVIMEVYRRCLEGYDIVSASCEHARRESTLFYSLFNKHSGIQYPLFSEDFRIISRRAINRVHQMSHIVLYRKAMYADCGLKIDNIKYVTNDQTKKLRHTHEEKSTRRKLAVDSFILFTDIAYKVSLVLSMIMLATSLFAFLYTVAIFITGSPVTGWTTTMLVLSFGLFGIFAILTFAVKYLSVILNLIFEKRKYVIGSIERL
jgi:dolichol-phosphate mannosyltransferase